MILKKYVPEKVQHHCREWCPCCAKGAEPLCALWPFAQTPSASVCVWRPVGWSIQRGRIGCENQDIFGHKNWFANLSKKILTFPRSARRREPTGLKWAPRRSRKCALGRRARRPGRASLRERLCCRQRCASIFVPAVPSQSRVVHKLIEISTI